MRKPITQEEWDAYVASVLADDYRMPAWEIAGRNPGSFPRIP